MGLSFLVPAFLVGLAAVAIPIIVHLTQRRRREVVFFPSLMFLHKIPFRSVRRQKIRHWPLLLIRALAIIAVVAAFARPLFKDADLGVGGSVGPRELIVLVDRSYSMGHGDRFSLAVEAARAELRQMGPDDRGSLILFASGASAPLRSSPDRDRLLNALERATLSSGVTRYGPALKLAQSVLEVSQLSHREVVLISDFQRSGWSGDEGVRFPEGTVVRTIPVGDGAAGNIAISQVALQRETFSGRERVRAVARVTQTGGAAVDDLAIVLEVDGREIETLTVALTANSARTVEFRPFTLAGPNVRGTIRTAGDLLSADDAFHFALSPGQDISVLVVEGNGAGAEASLFLRRALEISSEANFQVDVIRRSAFGASHLDGRSVVVLNDSRFPAGAAGQALRAFVERGGGLLVALGENSSWPQNQMDMLPAPFEPPQDPENGEGRLGYLDYSHPVFQLFRGPRSGDFSGARFFRHRPLALNGSEGVLARYDNGEVALAERTVGNGRVLVWTSSLDDFWNDLALQPVFLPFVHEVISYLDGKPDALPWFTADQVLDLADERLAAALGVPRDQEESPLEGRVVLAPSGDAVPLPQGEGPRFLRLEEQGFYEIRRPESNEARPLVLAVNVDLAESDLATLDPEELAASVSARVVESESVREGSFASTISLEDRERRQALWRYLLLAVFVLLALETMVSNRLSRVRL